VESLYKSRLATAEIMFADGRWKETILAVEQPSRVEPQGRDIRPSDNTVCPLSEFCLCGASAAPGRNRCSMSDKAIAGKERTRLRRIFVRLQEAITGA
jgi:predicted nucleic acid-binding Zn ribbon protein